MAKCASVGQLSPSPSVVKGPLLVGLSLQASLQGHAYTQTGHHPTTTWGCCLYRRSFPRDRWEQPAIPQREPVQLYAANSGMPVLMHRGSKHLHEYELLLLKRYSNLVHQR